MQVILTVTEGPHEGRAFTFREHDNFIVGRGKHAHFQLPFKDKYFSRVHFVVEVNPPQCRLVDVGSRNGTYVNGQKVTAADLRDGDVIRGGKTVICVSVEQPESECVAAEPSPPPQLTPVLPNPKPVESTLSLATQIPSGPTSACIVCGGSVYLSALSAEPKSLCSACESLTNSHAQPIDGYRIVRELGRGGMGVVYLAVRASDNTVTALKTITPANVGSKRDIALFLREARILGELDHPKIVKFREMGECNGQLFFAMDYVRGADAARLLKQTGPLPIGRAVRLVGDLLEALEYAHAKKFVHRDIKPANLLVTDASGRETGWLADFGLARVYQASRLSGLTMTGNIGGTSQFMPPEQITNYRDAKPPADIYAAGATLYNLLTGRFIFDFECRGDIASWQRHLLHLSPDGRDVVSTRFFVEASKARLFLRRELQRLNRLDPRLPVGQASGVVSPLGLVEADPFRLRGQRLHD